MLRVVASKVKLHFISKIALGLLWSPKGTVHATGLWYVSRRRFRHGPLTIESYGSAPPPEDPRAGGQDSRRYTRTSAYSIIHFTSARNQSRLHTQRYGAERFRMCHCTS